MLYNCFSSIPSLGISLHMITLKVWLPYNFRTVVERLHLYSVEGTSCIHVTVQSDIFYILDMEDIMQILITVYLRLHFEHYRFST